MDTIISDILLGLFQVLVVLGVALLCVSGLIYLAFAAWITTAEYEEENELKDKGVK